MRSQYRNVCRYFNLSLWVCSCVCTFWAQGPIKLDTQLQTFKALSGSEQVALVFNERFHGRSLLFWRRSAEVWLTAADARLYGEQEILVSSPDPSINGALAAEVKSSDVERARYAVSLLCLRGRFVPKSEFLLKQVNATSWSEEERPGRFSPFAPNLEKLGQEASKALNEAIKSPEPKLRNTAKLYTFSLLDELASVPTLELAKRWRAGILSAHPCSGYSRRNDEPIQLIFLLERALAARGVDAVVAITSLLKTETDAEARYEEIYMLQFLDAAVVRLRGSVEGRDAILTAKEAFRKKLQICGKLYKPSEVTENSWRGLEDQFLKDKFDCGVGSWATLIAVALDQEYDTHLSVPFEKGYRKCGPRMEEFLSHLTELDPTFPAWEFPSTASVGDMLHPKFLAKIQRYYEAFLKTNPRASR